MQARNLLMAAMTAVAASAQAADGLQTVTSAHPVATTMDRLEQKVGAAGFRVFARIDHAAGAKSVDMPLRPTELLIFGNPKGGTLLMQSTQTVGIDLPLKYLVWEAEDGGVHIGWNSPAWVAGRHAIDDRGPVVDKIAGALGKFANEAASP
jgi:uncharacterized protein (DUF302 family)